MKPDTAPIPRLRIADWNEADRPREKFEALGANTLSKAELLAILIGSGTPEQSAVELMRHILRDYDDSLVRLGRTSIAELCRYKGVGPAKAITILAACELGRRRESEGVERETMDNAAAIYRYFRQHLTDTSVEEAHALLLDNRLRLIRSVLIARGGLNQTLVDVRVLLREALIHSAVHVVFCHNHPSGCVQPSREDDLLTQRLRTACEAVSLRLIDHLVFADTGYYSYAEAGKL